MEFFTGVVLVFLVFKRCSKVFPDWNFAFSFYFQLFARNER